MNKQEESVDEIIARRFAAMIQGPDIICHQCNGPAKRVTLWGKVFTLCDPCFDDEQEQRGILDQRKHCLDAWDAQCPSNFRVQIDPKRLHQAMVPALDMSGFEGVALIGESGAGKTRVAWQLLRRAAAAGKSVYAITHSAFRTAASNRHDRDGMLADTARNTIARAHRAQVLLLDDVGKGAATETSDEALLALLNHRRDNRLATHWTANSGSVWLKARFGTDKGPAIVLRLRDLVEGRIFTTALTTKE